MKVHLIKTPEYDSKNFSEVYEFLSSFDGPIKFIPSYYEFNHSRFEFLGYSNFRNETGVKALLFNITMQSVLSWSILFTLCDFYRNAFKIDSTDFVILLTDRKNDLNWFSHTENRNVFVHTDNWHNYTNSNSKYAIGYQVIENILQSLMKLDITNIPNDVVHINARGCMNDFCGDKEQIILKLRTADICQDCLDKMIIEDVDDGIISQALEIFEAIRNKLLFKQDFTRHVSPKKVSIDMFGKVIVGEKEIRLDFLPKTLFIFFLIHKEGTTLNDLQNYKDELMKIYTALRPGAEESKIDELIKPYHQDGTFSKNKSTLNRKLREQLGEPLANFYCLDGNRGEAFCINIQSEFICIDIRY